MDEQSIFLEAIKRDDSQDRADFVAQACGGDEHLRHEVELLLRAHAKAEGYLQGTPPEIDNTIEQGAADRIGTQIGPYRLLQQIGEGGMGAVYMAEQSKPVKRRVALKIIKAGMDSKQVIGRFEAERQALAMMDHPNIARLLDVGTTDAGHPYFVMELVKGVPIDTFCDGKKLTVQQRLEMFIAICDAVQHAHQKGIIHRDLKPSNILVAEYDERIVPKIIDFGLAKALHQNLTELTMFTQLGQVVGTLAYMSPEQSKMNQLDVDTRTDIYSLGVLLYKLLTGETPFDQKRLSTAAYSEAMRIIQEEEPPRPSTRLSGSKELDSIASNRHIESHRLGLLLRGDLDWIVMKALEKDRARRYQTANGLAADIRRHLAGEPTVAAPPTAGYRMQKFVRRHRVAVAAALALAIILVIGMVGTSTGLAWALREKNRADELYDEAKASAEEERKAKEAAEETAREIKIAEDETRFSHYVATIQSADKLLDDQSIVIGRSVLKNAPAKFRDWEWWHLAFRAWPEQEEFRLDPTTAAEMSSTDYWQQGYVRAVQEFVVPDVNGGMSSGQFSTDGRRVLLTLYTGGNYLFSMETGDVVREFQRPVGSFLGVGLSPDESRLAGFVFSGGAVIWDVADGRILRSHPVDFTQDTAWTCIWSNDQKYLISAHMGGAIRIWDSQSLQLTRELSGHDGDVMSLYLPASGNEVWSASSDGTLRKWALDDGRELIVKHSPLEGPIRLQSIGPNGKLAFSLGEDGRGVIWDIETEQAVQTLAKRVNPSFDGDARFISTFSPDAEILAVMDGRSSVAIFDVSDGKLLTQFGGDGSTMTSMQFSPDRRGLLTITENGRALLWRCFDKPESPFDEAHQDTIYQVDIDEAGEILLTGSYDKTAIVWDLKTRNSRMTYREHLAPILAADLSPDHQLAATLDANGVLDVWEVSTGHQKLRIDPGSDAFSRLIPRAGGGLQQNMLSFSAVMSTGLFTPDGSYVVAYEGDSMKAFNVRTGAQTKLEGAEYVGWPIFSFDSSMVAILKMNGRDIGIWDIQTGKNLRTLRGHRKALVMAHFSPVDHRLVTGSMDAQIFVWDAVKGERLLILDDYSPHPASCRFSSDGKWIIAGYTDCIGRVWDAANGELLMRFAGHNNRLRDVRLSPDRSRLLSWSIDDHAILWDATRNDARQLMVFEGASRLVQCRWTPDSRDILGFWSDGKIEVWSGANRKDREAQPGIQSFSDDQIKVWLRDINQLRTVDETN